MRSLFSAFVRLSGLIGAVVVGLIATRNASAPTPTAVGEADLGPHTPRDSQESPRDLAKRGRRRRWILIALVTVTSLALWVVPSRVHPPIAMSVEVKFDDLAHVSVSDVAKTASASLDTQVAAVRIASIPDFGTSTLTPQLVRFEIEVPDDACKDLARRLGGSCSGLGPEVEARSFEARAALLQVDVVGAQGAPVRAQASDDDIAVLPAGRQVHLRMRCAAPPTSDLVLAVAGRETEVPRGCRETNAVLRLTVRFSGPTHVDLLDVANIRAELLAEHLTLKAAKADGKVGDSAFAISDASPKRVRIRSSGKQEFVVEQASGRAGLIVRHARATSVKTPDAVERVPNAFKRWSAAWLLAIGLLVPVAGTCLYDLYIKERR